MAENSINGIKNIQIQSKTSYPIITAYEFEFLKTEAEIKDLLKPATIYFIVQRPLLYMKNLYINNGIVSFEITDDSGNEPLLCEFDPIENGFALETEEFLLNLHFYKNIPDTEAPYNDIGAIKLYTAENKFIVWYTPQKFIYEYFAGSLKANITGDIIKFIDYKVHYIGQAFSQDIWARLTGHEKMQAVLTMENIINSKASKNSFEISLILMEIEGFDELNIAPVPDFMIAGIDTPIFHELKSDKSIEEFYMPALSPKAPELTNEVEAMLISTFKPAYNNILFDNYPKIKTGTRSAGYTTCTLLSTMFPAKLVTDHHIQDVVLPVKT